MRRFVLVIIAVTLLSGSVAQAASYLKRDGTIVDPILNTSGISHSYSGNDLEPGADPTNANLRGADLTDAFLWLANLTNADLTSAILHSANLTFADLYRADLAGAYYVVTTTGSPYYYGNTALPAGFDPVAKGWTLSPYCDFTPDAACNVADINQMFDAGDLVTGVAVAGSTDRLDLVDNDTINAADITEWLSQAATANGHGSPYLRGDTDLDRNVDLADYISHCQYWIESNRNHKTSVQVTSHSSQSTSRRAQSVGTFDCPRRNCYTYPPCP